MSTPGSSRNKKYEDGRRKQTGDTVTFNVDTTSWSSEDRARAAEYQNNFNQPFPPKTNYDISQAPNGPLDVRMGRFTPVPDSPHGRHHKSDSRSAAPGPYNGSPVVNRLPTQTTSQRINDFPHELGGRTPAYPVQAPPSLSQRPKDYPQSNYQTTPYYPPSTTSAPNVPRSPDGVTRKRIAMAMAPRPSQSGKDLDPFSPFPSKCRFRRWATANPAPNDPRKPPGSKIPI
ncbi:hypothetical protein B0H11DRAFT_2026437 [Mycena galericulata]|nr:hypothetical protein B0H11DRAFT_2026437 [Mycena galericulata]